MNPLVTCDQCQARLAELEPIDFFLARELQTTLGSEDPLLFHLWLALQGALRQGHSCLNLGRVAGEILWADPEGRKPGYRFADRATLDERLASLDLTPQANRPLVLEGDELYLRRYWRFETELADALKARMAPLVLDDATLALARKTLARLFPKAPIGTGTAGQDGDQAGDQVGDKKGEPDWQAVAVANALGRRFSILSGGPGTGKTYTVTRLLATLQAVAGGGLRIAMAAPTGKAKQRLQESIAGAKAQLAADGLEPRLLEGIPEEAHTLHGLLGVRPNSTQLRHHMDKPLAVDLLLIDEASMVDLPMMTRLLRALPETARLILVGDANQLPSIAVGSVLADLAPLPHGGYTPAAAQQIEALCGYRVPVAAGAGDDHVCLLRRSHRFDGEGGIGRLAAAVIDQDAAEGWRLLQASREPETGGQLAYQDPAGLDDWLDEAVARYYRPLVRATDLAAAFAALAAFRILVPTRVGPWGVEALNARIEAQLARLGGGITPGGAYPGRPIMVTRNQHALKVFNGDVGVIWRNEAGVLEACFEQDGGVRRLNLGLLAQVEPVYAMTIHKTQGSEFDRVALLLPDQAGRLLSPELVYTGITRARSHCCVIAGEALWQQALARRQQRCSGLGPRLRA